MGRKQKRCYHRFMSGIQATRGRGHGLRFMTLTTSEEATPGELHRHWRSLVARLRRRWSSFQYCVIKTDEGNGVLHILFDGPYIPQAWLSSTWQKLHRSKIVDIRLVTGSMRKIATYLVWQYLGNQSSSRLSWSWGWVFPGFCGAWRGLKRAMRGRVDGKLLVAWRWVCWCSDKVQRLKIGRDTIWFFSVGTMELTWSS